MDARLHGWTSKPSSFTFEPLGFPSRTPQRQIDPLRGLHTHKVFSPATSSTPVQNTTPPEEGNKHYTPTSLAQALQQNLEKAGRLHIQQSDVSARSFSRSRIGNRVTGSRLMNSDSKYTPHGNLNSPDHPMSFHVNSSMANVGSFPAPKLLADNKDDLGARSPHTVEGRGSKGVGVDLETGASHMVRLTPVGKTYVQYAVRNRPFVSHVSEVVTSREEVAKLRTAADQGAAWARDNAALREQVRVLQAELGDTKGGHQGSYRGNGSPGGRRGSQSVNQGVRFADGSRSSNRSSFYGTDCTDGTHSLRSSAQEGINGASELDKSSQHDASAAPGFMNRHNLSQREVKVNKQTYLYFIFSLQIECTAHRELQSAGACTPPR